MTDFLRCPAAPLGIFSMIAVLPGSVSAEVVVEYQFDGNTNDSSGSGIHGELVGDATIQDGQLSLAGGLDNGLSIPLGDRNPFGGDRDWTVSFDFTTIDGSSGPLFSSDGAPLCEEGDDECFDMMPRHAETGNQAGSINVFMWDSGNVVTDFWFIGAIESEFTYNDDQPHSYVGSYIAATGEFTQTIDGEDIVSDFVAAGEEVPTCGMRRTIAT